MCQINPFTLKLKKNNLIEASAGTGKTYLIIQLYLRFLLNINLSHEYKYLSIDKLLIVTFTENTILEIKNRIIRSINDLKKSCLLKKPINEDISELYNLIKDRHNIVNILQNYENITHFISVFTIHSFCKKILFTYPIFSKLYLGTQINENEYEVIREAVINFWHQYFSLLPKCIIKIILKYWRDPNQLSLSIISFFNFIDFHIVYKQKYLSILCCYKYIIKYIRFIKSKWLLMKDMINNQLLLYSINKHIYNKKYLNYWSQIITRWCYQKTDSFDIPVCLKRFSYKYIQLQIKQDNCHLLNFYLEIKNLFIIKDDLYNFILMLCISFVKKYLSSHKKKHNYLFFNDLIIILNKLLIQDKKKLYLTNLIRRKYPVILIDEFQDTDYIQFNIFKYIYIYNKSIFNTILVLIGDPKQTIYFFRGITLDKYLLISKRIQNRFTCYINWRSTYNMVKSINYLFKRFPNPFGFKEIPYISVKSPLNNTYWYMYQKNKIEKSIKFYTFLHTSNLHIKYLLAHYCAHRILDLLDSKKQFFLVNNNIFTKRSLVPNDIAIIVHKNKEISLIYDVFKKYNIPVMSNYVSNTNVFSTLEAKELLLILKAILYPNIKLYIRNAISTTFYDIDLFMIQIILTNNYYYNNLINEFNEYYSLWDKYNIYTMIRFLVKNTNLVNKMYFRSFGKQYLINIIHISEILLKVSSTLHSKKLLIYWLEKNIINSTITINNSYYIRSFNNYLNTITLVTVHKSKSLQYNIVFLPYLFFLKRKNQINYIYDLKYYKFFIYLHKKYKQNIDNLMLSENMCLLYVAITRAVYQCNIFLYFPSGILEKKYFYTLAIIRLITKNNILNLFKLDLKQLLLDNNINFKYIKNIFINLNNYQKNHHNIKYFSCLDSLPIIKNNFKKIYSLKKIRKIYSYSTLFKSELSFYSKLEDTNFNKRYNLNYISYLDFIDYKYDLPRGKTIGILLHKILEEINFFQFNLCCQQFNLDQYNIDIKYHIVIKKIIYNVLNVNLYSINSNLLDKNINFLSKEFEFYIPINKRFSINKYFDLINKYDYLSKYASSIKMKLDVSNLYGYFNGVIDVLFRYKDKYYIIDYKSNWLGTDYCDYSINNMFNVMLKYRYDLQYQIYVLAVHNYLKYKFIDYTYEKYFGGIYYIFLRGLKLNLFFKSKTGVLYIKPYYKMVYKLSKFFTGLWDNR